MASLICIKMVCGTICQLFNMANRFLWYFSNLRTSIRNWFPGGARYPLLPAQLIRSNNFYIISMFNKGHHTHPNRGPMFFIIMDELNFNLFQWQKQYIYLYICIYISSTYLRWSNSGCQASWYRWCFSHRHFAVGLFSNLSHKFHSCTIFFPYFSAFKVRK